MKGTLWTVLVLVAVTLSGCADDPVEEEDDDVPTQLTQDDMDRLEQLVTEQHPRTFAFPGQEVLDPVFDWVNGTVGPTANTGVEPIDDDGPADAGGEIQSTDISGLVPVGQPVELRLKLKWAGDPGSSADLDLYTNVPGQHSSYSPGHNEESWNWNRITKGSVVNTARIEGQPFEVGVQATNGKVLVEDVDYSVEVEAYFPENPVLPPLVPHALVLPEGGTGFILESEPVTGDEHIDTDLIIVGPDDIIHRSIHHNDIGTETLFIAATTPGEYIFYIAQQHGGFIRVETDVPNPDFQAREVTKVMEETVLHSGAVAAPASPGTYGEEGALELPGTPLDLYAFIHISQGASISGDIQMDVLSQDGVVHSMVVSGSALTDEGRVGDAPDEDRDRTLIVPGDFGYGLRGNAGGGVDVGYGFVGYER